jgi:hypothetical protein
VKFLRLPARRSRYQADAFRSSLTFPARLRCFDPAATLRRAGLLLLMVAAALYVLPTSVYVAAAALSVSMCGSLLLSRIDRRRFSCTVLRLEGCKLLDISEHHAGVQGVLLVDRGFVSGLRSRMRLVTARGVSHGMRRLPLVLRRSGSVVRWQDTDMDVPLEGDAEIHGAIGVVSCGRAVCLEVIYGSRMGERSRVLATRFSSVDGAIQSWDPELLANPFFSGEFLGMMHTRVFDRVRPGSGSVKGAQASTEK